MAWILSGVTTAIAIALGVTLLQTRRRANVAVAEAQRYRQMAKDRAARISTLSHEVRTPLSLIQGAAELLTDRGPGPLTVAQERFVSTISTNSAAVIEMAEQLLAEARLDASLFTVRMRRVEVRGLVRRQVRSMRNITDATIELDLHGGPVYVRGDASLLTQAISNLVTNAAKHAGSGATIRVRVVSGDHQCVIGVTDNGRGMSRSEREGLFEPFVTTTSHQGGTGLGMTITRKIVELHGGRVLVDTASSLGTSVYIVLSDISTDPDAADEPQIDD